MKRIASGLGIIILTGYSTKDVAIEALKAHADDYVEKPLNINRIKESIENLLEIRKQQGQIGSGGKGKIERVKHFLQRNYDKKLTLQDAAKVVHLSPKYLSRIFEQDTGRGFSRYKLEIKINKAKELLKRTAYNISQISDQLGYENTESFIRTFKQFSGQTPTEYRSKNSKRKTKAKRYKKQ